MNQYMKNQYMKNQNTVNQGGSYDFLFIGGDKYGKYLRDELLLYFNRMYPTKVLIDLGIRELYPDIIKDFKKTLNKMKGHLDYNKRLGIFIGDSGIGMTMCANKIKPIRAAVCNNMNDIFTAVIHQNINVLCLGNSLNVSEMINIVESYMKLSFDELPIHVKCVNKITKI
jgi:RpiB/LacA/LacB family sugar-phosphate isomerase